MNEKLLQFIWQFQYFNKGELKTVSNEGLQVIAAGQLNTNQGPDFLDAKVKIGKTTWAGNIELHLKSSDWKKHNHDKDANYKNVILHIVWENDILVNEIPVLELRNRVSRVLQKRYEELMKTQGFIPCENIIASVRPVIIQSWMDRMLAERLTRKTNEVEKYLKQNNYHWEETFWWLLARNFGMKINADAFEAVAKSIPLAVLAKHKNQIHQLEGLLLGQAGLLNKKFKDEYPILLSREYEFLKKKYTLHAIQQPVYFLRMRPGNFPTIRLAQLAMLINSSVHLFSKIRETKSVDELKKSFAVIANDYWHYHYRFDDEGSFKQKKLGSVMIDNILINTVCTLLFAYGHLKKEAKFKDKAVGWLEEINAESNSITRGFESTGVSNKNARESQALIELKNLYCNKKRCLECAVGNAILKSN